MRYEKKIVRRIKFLICLTKILLFDDYYFKPSSAGLLAVHVYDCLIQFLLAASLFWLTILLSVCYEFFKIHITFLELLSFATVK